MSLDRRNYEPDLMQAAVQSSPIGYGGNAGVGGAVTQATNRATGVTINTLCGTITTNTTSLAALASAEFTVTNSQVAIGDVVVICQQSGSSNAVSGVAGVTTVSVTTVAAGSFIISVNNLSTTTAETGAIIINFAVIKAVSA
jgi:hypothetical protein